MRIETQAGESLTGQEIADTMADCGFVDIQVQGTSFPHGIVTGLRP